MRRTAGLLAGIALAGCAGSTGGRLPGWAYGSVEEAVPVSLEGQDLIPYRALTRADFLSDEPPAAFRKHRDRIGAATCAYLGTDEGLQIMVQSTSERGVTRYDASVANLAFRALMSRSCSWWNDDLDDFPAEYVLEHEQIHFALFELGARRANAGGVQLRASASSLEEARAAVERQLQDLIDRHTQTIAARGRAFDEDTSMAHERAKQAAWLDLVERELAATEASAD